MKISKPDKVLTSPNFFALFKVLSLGATNDNILKNALLVLITFSGYTVFNLPTAQVVNLAVLLFILPFFLFSSYAGKLADSSDKAKIIRVIKLCEIVIMLIAALGFSFHLLGLLLLCLFFMGVHSAFFGPLKYSIVPQYLPRKDFVMANGYIEMGTFVAILLGQTIGSWFAANKYIMIVVWLMLFISIGGYYYSRQLDSVPSVAPRPKFFINIFKDSWLMYNSVTMNKVIKKNLHSLSWFWAMGVVFTTQYPVLTLQYFGGDAHVYSVLLILFTLGMGVGSLICAKVSIGRAVHRYIPLGALGMSMGYFILLLTHHEIVPIQSDCIAFMLSVHGISIMLVGLFIGLAAGFYSVTCYNELQLTAPDEIRSQVISAVNILNAVYMVSASVISAVLLLFMSVWWLIMTMALLNILFVLWDIFLNPEAT